MLPSVKPGEYRIALVEERHGQRISYPALGYTQPYDIGAEQPRSEANIELLSRLAESTGGEISARTSEGKSRSEVTKNYQPMRQPLIILDLPAVFIRDYRKKILFFRFRVDDFPQ